MVEVLVAPTDESPTRGVIIVVIDTGNKEKFEKLIDGQASVKKYFAYPTNDKGAQLKRSSS